MNTCLNCSCAFPIHQMIDGKSRNLSSRKYCIKCSPFGIHNTKPLHLELGKCSKCNITLDDNNSYRKKDRDSPKSWCKLCTKNDTLARAKKNKLLAVEYKGGKCYICGYNKSMRALEFHHVNPENKSYYLNSLMNCTWEKIRDELDKCVLLCSNCHREEEDLKYSPIV